MAVQVPVSMEYRGAYAEYYDAVYQHRDIRGDCHRLAELLALDRIHENPVRLLDFGCGTGAHALQWGRVGLDCVGIDVAPDMIRVARRERDRIACPVRFLCATAQDALVQLGRQYFDCFTSLFNVFNCMSGECEMLENLEHICDLIKPGARGVVELWNGEAAMKGEPQIKTRHVEHPRRPGVHITHTLTPFLDRAARTCTLEYELQVHDHSSGGHEHFVQSQQVHFLTPPEYRALFEAAGFEVLREFPTRRTDGQLSGDDWFVSYGLRRSDA